MPNPPPGANPLQFILLDLLGRGLPINIIDGSGAAQGSASASASQAQSNGMGTVYSGDMPPMMWIQREQQRTARTDAAAVSEANALKDKGNTAFRDGEYSRAIQLYSEAIELDSTNTQLFTNRSFAYHKIGNNAAAAADAREAIHLDSKNYKAYFRLGVALSSLGDYQEALTNLKIALEHATSQDDKESISITIAKCEAKLARTQTLQTPMTPNGVGASASGSATAASSSSYGPPPCSPSFPSGGESHPDAGSPGPRASPSAQPVAAQPPVPRLEEVVDALSELRRKRSSWSLPDMSMCEALQQVFDEERSAKIKNLLAVANPQQLSNSIKAAEAAQENLRRSAKTTDRQQFQGALAERDDALHNLWSIAGEAKDAVAKLKEMAVTEGRLLGSIKELSAAAVADSSSTAVAEDAPPARPTTDLSALLAERSELSARLDAMNAASLRTNQCATSLLNAIHDECRLAEELASPLERLGALRRELIAHANYFAATGYGESELQSASRLEALDSMASTLQRIESDAKEFRRNGELGPRLLQEEAELERERLFQERQRIHLQAEIEWMRVKEEEPHKIAFMTQRLDAARARITNIVEKQAELQKRILALIDNDHPELSWKAAAGGSRLLKWIKGSGLWMNCAFSDFRILSTLSSTASSKVYLTVYKSEEVVLKEIPMEGDKARRRFQNEVNITLGCSNHPNIIKVKGVFFDGPFAYIVMPYMRRGSLKSLMAKKEVIPWFRVQEIFRQIASALVHLHERGIVHADIKPSNILFGDDGVPLLADFGIAKDYGRYGEREMTVPVAPVGTVDFMAPELLGATSPSGGDASASKLPTAKTDVWSFGVTMYCVTALNGYLMEEREKSESEAPVLFPVVLPGAKCVSIPVSLAGGNERLADLIGQALTVAPEHRPTCMEILSHSYFAVSLVEDLVNNKELVQSNEKLEALHSYIQVIRASSSAPVLVSVVRNHMVESVSNILERFDESDIMRRIMVVFQGEQGVDEGALTTEMFSQYFQQLVTKQKLLVRPKSDDSDSDGGSPAGVVLGGEYTVSADPRISEKQLVVLGKALLKCLVENRPLPIHLNASVLKYLAGTEVSMSDLEGYDATLAQSLQQLFLLSSDDLEDAGLMFDEFPEEFLKAHEEGGSITTKTKVTVKNVKEYVALKVKYELIGKREHALAAIKKGFLCSPMLNPHLKLLSATELMMLLCGQQHILPQLVIDSLDFQGFPATSSTPEDLREIIRGSGQNNLRRFLRLCTSAVSLPHNGLPRKIKVLCTADTARLPVGHACVFQLDLPDYNDKSLLRSKLATALAHVNDGFHIA